MSGGQLAPSQPWRLVAGGLALRVRVTPKSSRDAVAGTIDTRDGPAVKVAVRAIPEDGAANVAVARLIAKWLDTLASRISVTAGITSRVKVLKIDRGDADLGTMIDLKLAAA